MAEIHTNNWRIHTRLNFEEGEKPTIGDKVFYNNTNGNLTLVSNDFYAGILTRILDDGYEIELPGNFKNYDIEAIYPTNRELVEQLIDKIGWGELLKELELISHHESNNRDTPYFQGMCYHLHLAKCHWNGKDI